MTITRIAISLTLCLVLFSGCSPDKDNKNESATTAPAEKIDVDPQFSAAAASVCTSIDQSVLDQLSDELVMTNPESAQLALSGAEEQYDKIIAGFAALDPPENIVEDWETLVDDFTAIRDSFPSIARILTELSTYTTQTIPMDESSYEQQQDQIDELQKEYNKLMKGNAQRAEAIEEFAQKANIEECVL